MVNTLGNAPEKVTSTPKGSSNSALKKIVAAAIALTLSGEPAEAKTYNKQEFPTEMVVNVPGTISPMTENVEQSSVPNYINNAQIAVRKYYPQYEEYFKEIINKINKLDKSLIEIINHNIDNAIKKLEDELKTEKQVYTMILMTLEKLDGKSTFYNDNSIIKNEEEREDEEGTATVITKYIKKGFEKKGNEIKALQDKRDNLLKGLNTIINKENITKEDIIKLLTLIEDFYNLIENTEYINDKRNKNIFEEYYKKSKELGREPSETGKKIIKWLKDH